MPFKKGKSGNPKGRPAGVPNKRGVINNVIEAYGKANNIDVESKLIASLIKQALAGDTTAAKIIIERMIPAYKPVSRTIKVPGALPPDLVKKAEKILELSLNGTLTLDESKTLLSSLADLMKIKEVLEIEGRISALEEENEKRP